MPDLPNFPALFRVARDEALARNAKISRDAIERDGTDANILVAGAAAIGDQVTGQVALLAASLFLDSAKGKDLDRLVFDRYGLVRKPAAASQGTIIFTTTAPAGITFTIPSGVKLSSSDGKQFITVESSVFTAGSIGPVAVAVRSVLAGGDQNVIAGALTSLLSQIVSQPADLTITNPFATAGADDAESDDSLLDRARRFFTTVQRGTIRAIEAAALNVPGVRKATAVEVIDSLGRPARFIQLVVADAFTEQFVNFDTIPARYQVQSQFLSLEVFNALSDVRAAGIFVQVFVANIVLQAFQLALTFTAGANVNSSALQARANLVTYVNALAPGQSFVYNDALSALNHTPGLARVGNTIISPAGNVAVKPLQALRTSLGLVSALSAQTSQPLITGSNPDAFVIASM